MNSKHFKFDNIEKTSAEIFNTAIKIAETTNEEIIYIEVIIIHNIMENDFHTRYKNEYIVINTCRNTESEFTKFKENFRNLLEMKRRGSLWFF